jgi:hypothetical protein
LQHSIERGLDARAGSNSDRDVLIIEAGDHRQDMVCAQTPASSPLAALAIPRPGITSDAIANHGYPVQL